MTSNEVFEIILENVREIEEYRIDIGLSAKKIRERANNINNIIDVEYHVRIFLQCVSTIKKTTDLCYTYARNRDRYGGRRWALVGIFHMATDTLELIEIIKEWIHKLRYKAIVKGLTEVGIEGHISDIEENADTIKGFIEKCIEVAQNELNIECC